MKISSVSPAISHEPLILFEAERETAQFKIEKDGATYVLTFDDKIHGMIVTIGPGMYIKPLTNGLIKILPAMEGVGR